ncbi:recombinase family protein [Marinomonas rhizomae]|uniref:DNA invertase Pin-like site-specific DNA recombinase n=1 Tax=Marinomonas rhizomae TaxID=491948 RepID=A0A366IYC7_9GAMM|nr:recombinase family protein [Marinomonas rhizomae]RBP79587.1 DNA invertase Pin-like site-specific DNA recombinase [Marinomonas rhizomae]RNF71587.1 recombinase family protein [Marinomonas rhizomae]
MSKKAYSYIRYSSPQQAKGDSYRRQFSKTVEYCKENGYELDTDLIYKELGKSASKPNEQKRLKKFIEDCETGRVEKGSLLVVENLDRLSRQKINIAMSQFLNILEYVDIYTLQDKKLYSNSDGNDKNQLIDIITSLVVMSRAYEESETKKLRLKEVWQEKRDKIQVKKINSSYPHWLTVSEDCKSFIIKEKAADAIRKIFELCNNGYGFSQILRYLNNNIEKYPTPSSRSKTGLWVRSTIQLLLSDRRIIGEIQLYKGAYKEKVAQGEAVKDYYPKIVDEETFLKAQISLKSRSIQKGKIGKYSFSNLFRGIAVCYNCSNVLEFVDKGKNNKRTRRYLTCTDAKRGGSCNVSTHYKYDELELMLLHLISENGFLPVKVDPSEIEIKIQKNKELKKSAENKLNILIEQDFTATAIINKIKDLNNEIDFLKKEIKELEDNLEKVEIKYTFEDLINEMKNEQDEDLKFNNRIRLNSYLKNKIKTIKIAKLHNIYMNFTMIDNSVYDAIIDIKYNLGGCEKKGDKDFKIKKLNGTENYSIDIRSWSLIKSFNLIILKYSDLMLGLENKNKNEEDLNDIDKLNKEINRVNLLISNFIKKDNDNSNDFEKILTEIMALYNLFK